MRELLVQARERFIEYPVRRKLSARSRRDLRCEGSRTTHQAPSQHGMTEGSICTALSRLRAQFRQIVREDVADLVEDPAEIDDEITHLLRALTY